MTKQCKSGCGCVYGSGIKYHDQPCVWEDVIQTKPKEEWEEDLKQVKIFATAWEDNEDIIAIHFPENKPWEDFPVGMTLSEKDAAVVDKWFNSRAGKELIEIFVRRYLPTPVKNQHPHQSSLHSHQSSKEI